MVDVTISCQIDHLEAVLEKIDNRLADPRLARNPHRGKSRGELQAVLWSRVEEEARRYLKDDSAARDIYDRAFVFGEMLNDTVFMLTPVSSVGGAVQLHTFDVGRAPPGLNKYTLDFYDRL